MSLSNAFVPNNIDAYFANLNLTNLSTNNDNTYYLSVGSQDTYKDHSFHQSHQQNQQH